MYFNKYIMIRFKCNFDWFVDNLNFFFMFNLLVKLFNVFWIYMNVISIYFYVYVKIFVGFMN